MSRNSTSADPAPTGTRSSTPQAGADEGWGPVMDVTGRRPVGRRLLVVIVVLVLALPIGWGIAVMRHTLDSMERTEVAGLSTRSGGRMNVLLTGSDSREDLTRRERQQLATGEAAGERTDVIMVLSVTSDAAELLAFPRDLYVTRCDGSEGRINAALAVGGTSCLVRTVQDLSGIPVHHTMAIDFGGFRDLVDALGGIEICTDRELVDPKAGLDLAEGCHDMDGTTALGFVRTRQLDNDLERIKRQQQFLQALVGTALTPDTLLDPARTWEVSGSVARALTVDEDLGAMDLVRLARGARAMANGLDAQTVPSTPATIGGAAVLIPNLEEAEALFEPLRGGEVPDPDADGDGEVPDVRVGVLNGANISGLAGRVSERLEARGWDVAVVDNGPDVAATEVVHAAGHEEAATRLATELGADVAVREAASVGDLALGDAVDVVVVAGPDAEG